VEYSLTAKQRSHHEALGRRRPTVLALQALATKSAKASSRRLKKNGRSGNPASDEDEGYNSRESSSDSDGGKAASESSVDSDDERMRMDVEEEVEEISEESEDDDRGVADMSAKDVGVRKEKQTERIMMPEECRAHLRLLFAKEGEILSLVFGPHGPMTRAHDRAAASRQRANPDMFFMDVVSVPPSRFRPASIMGEQTFENPQTELLGKVLSTTLQVRDNNLALSAKDVPDMTNESRTRLYASLINSLFDLQVAVNSLIDTAKNPMIVRGGKLPPQGVKQVLEKKEGLFRMNMMVCLFYLPRNPILFADSMGLLQGKRVNYAARSVISPDVNIETNEIGVPPVFAKRLTFPEPVTPHNVRKMMQLVINGPKKHPGASYIQMEDGTLQSLVSRSFPDHMLVFLLTLGVTGTDDRRAEGGTSKSASDAQRLARIEPTRRRSACYSYSTNQPQGVSSS
jgi:DNA-directed RNA polymerase I subunit RPA1